MMGVLASGRSYVGVEPVARTVSELYRLGSRLCEHLEVDRSRVRLIEGPIQALPEAVFEADFAVTSPPYWTKEVYEGARDRISSEEWVEDFLVPMFKKVSGVLRPGGRFAVNVGNVKDGRKEVPLEKFTTETAQSVGFVLEATWRMMKASFGVQAKNRSEPILVFRIPSES